MSLVAKRIVESHLMKRLVVKVKWGNLDKTHYAYDLKEAISWMKMYPVDAKIEVCSKFSNKVIMGR